MRKRLGNCVVWWFPTGNLTSVMMIDMQSTGPAHDAAHFSIPFWFGSWLALHRSRGGGAYRKSLDNNKVWPFWSTGPARYWILRKSFLRLLFLFFSSLLVRQEMNGPELKQLCLHQLQLLSDSTILNIINGIPSWLKIKSNQNQNRFLFRFSLSGYLSTIRWRRSRTCCWWQDDNIHR